MIKITRGTTNDVYVTCDEKRTLTDPFYLVKFVSVSGKVTRFCVCTDVSNFPERYQKFEIVETDTPVSGTNQITLDIKGSWDYYIYEQTSATNTNPDLVDGVEVESGQIEVTHTRTQLKGYNGYQSTYKGYGG